MSDSISVSADTATRTLIITCDGEHYEMDLDTAADFLCSVMDACEAIGAVESYSPRVH